MSVLAVTGTGTEVGKTVVTAAIAALCPDVVTVMKPAQTGVTLRDPGDVDVVKQLVPHVETMELVRYPDPLSPAAAARLQMPRKSKRQSRRRSGTGAADDGLEPGHYEARPLSSSTSAMVRSVAIRSSSEPA